MKKSQRLRFYALVAKQAGGALLTDAELTEFRTLSALVAVHPTAENDTDDEKKEETEEEKKKRLEKEQAEKDKKEEEAKKSKAAKPGLAACLKSALSGLAGGTPAQAAAQIAALTTERDQARNDLATTQASLTSAKSGLDQVCGFLGTTATAVLGKTEAQVQVLLNARVADTIAGFGVNPKGLVAPVGEGAGTGEGGAGTKTELHKQFAAITDPNERAQFYAKHREKLFAD